MAAPALQIEELTMYYSTQQGWVKAVDGVSFGLARGESLGLVGESGCGKTSIALCLLKVLPDNARIIKGRIILDDTDLVSLGEKEMQRYRWKQISMVFQAAMSSLSPVHQVGHQVEEVIRVHENLDRHRARQRVAQLFQLVGLDTSLMDRYPHELSGGMKQRAVIALALACQPHVVIADEPTTALDVIVQHLILQELKQLQQRLGTAMVYISHDIGVIAGVSDRIAVMYAGKIVEMGKTRELFHSPRHPYTKALMSSFPRLRGQKQALASLAGDLPDLISPPSGCRFHPRCAYATVLCQEQEPLFIGNDPGGMVACWHPLIGDSGGGA